MKSKSRILFTCILFVVFVLPETTKAETASELINQAHKHDNMYTLGPESNQQKALSLYQSALTAEPDEKQRLHILYRMAQLCGSAYQLEKGEKPDFHRAISLYKEIIDSYPPEEPLVYKAMTSLCDHYTTLCRFETALQWAKRVIEYDTSQIQERLKAVEKQIKTVERDSGRDQFNSTTSQEQPEIIKLSKQVNSLKKTLSKIKHYQKVAVDQVAYSAALINPIYAHGELRNIADAYAGTFIADRAIERLRENMDRMPDLWSPQDNLPVPSSPALLADSGVPTVLNQSEKDIQTQPKIPQGVKQSYHSVEPDTTKKPGEDKHFAKEPRAPPQSYLSKHIVAATGLIVLAFVAIVIIKKGNYFLRN